MPPLYVMVDVLDVSGTPCYIVYYVKTKKQENETKTFEELLGYLSNGIQYAIFLSGIYSLPSVFYTFCIGLIYQICRCVFCSTLLCCHVVKDSEKCLVASVRFLIG